jgi:TRAP-type C4-dicarboxylate transport system permease small subunit
MGKVSQALKFIDNSLDRLCLWGLSICVFTMLGFSLLNIVLRGFETTFHWIDPLVRHLVFLCAFLGGAVATGKGNHIRMDLMGKIIETKKWDQFGKWLGVAISTVCLVALVWLFQSAWAFMKIELEFGKDVFWGIHSGVLVGIIPFGFAIIAFRFLVKIIEGIEK